MDISAKITGIKYQIRQADSLPRMALDDLDINDAPTSCMVESDDWTFGLSKWVSPKRTRSYPYERIYNTLQCAKRITVIPIIKDEGKNGDRDFIQWDTVSLMNLLDVFVIFAYYQKAERHPTRADKITCQQFNNKAIKCKIKEIKNFHSSALHWNLKEAEEALPKLINQAKRAYRSIGKRLGVVFHAEQGIDKFAAQFFNGVEEFMHSSRAKARDAQQREKQTTQPKEILVTQTKASLTIKNYLGGEYYLTVDEAHIQGRRLLLIESKHTAHGYLPSMGDIKDGLLKMFLYVNLKAVRMNGKAYQCLPILKLTSASIRGSISSSSAAAQHANFLAQNNFSKKQEAIIKAVFAEARTNRFVAMIEAV